MSERETIDMNKLTQKELLILLNSKVFDMNRTLDKLTGDYTDLLVRVSNIETRAKAWSALIAVLSSAITSAVISLIKS
ncbi:MAG: hypothetical protein COC06_07575 [Bacteroidales bacterium]|nr:MAG: hypothetical protein COC06_07575 [Bacteroidales bacterium]